MQTPVTVKAMLRLSGEFIGLVEIEKYLGTNKGRLSTNRGISMFQEWYLLDNSSKE